MTSGVLHNPPKVTERDIKEEKNTHVINMVPPTEPWVFFLVQGLVVIDGVHVSHKGSSHMS